MGSDSNSENEFMIKDMIGSGGFGRVYRCIDYDTDKEVAVKIIEVENHGIKDIIELSIMATYDHPFLAKAESISYKMNKIYIIQDWAITDLLEHCKKNRINDILLQKWSYEISQGLACLHKENIIHGDIKPANILLCSDNSVKLSDFSLSILNPNKNKKFSHSMGTMRYNPYEMINGFGWNEEIDIWSLGCTLYEISCSSHLIHYNKSNSDDKNLIKREISLSIEDICKNIEEDVLLNENYFNIQFIQRKSGFRNLVLDCLKLNPKNRITIKKIKKLNYFSKFQQTEYYIDSSCHNEIDENKKISLRKLCNRYVDDDEIISKTIELYSRCDDLDILRDEKLYTCLWIMYRMMKCGRIINDICLQSYEIKKYEKMICKHLNYRLHISYDKNWI